MAKKKTSSVTAVSIGSQLELTQAIQKIGDLYRTLNGIENDFNGRIQALQTALAEAATPIRDEIDALGLGVKAFADSNRTTLIPDKRKSLDLPTGTIAYREKPPRVSSTATAKFILTLLRKVDLEAAVERFQKRLSKVFLRIKLELDKDSALASPAKAKELGIEIESGVERFYIKPNTVELEHEVAA